MEGKRNERSEDGICIGIDIGADKSCCAVIQNGKVVVIPDNLGNLTSPTRVVYDKKADLHIGEEAVTLVRRGQIFPDCDLGSNLRLMGVEHMAIYIAKMILNAQEFLKCGSIENAVLIVPSAYGHKQREAMLAACQFAGLKDARLLNDSAAVVLAHTMLNKCKRREVGNCSIFVFTMGAESFSASVVDIDGEVCEVKAVTGCLDIGGRSFDDKLVQHCMSHALVEFDRHDVFIDNAKLLFELRSACRSAKEQLSESMSTWIRIDTPRGKFATLVTRELFEELCIDLFDEITVEIVEALSIAAAAAASECANFVINEIVVAGRGAQIPRITKILNDKISKRMHVNPNIRKECRLEGLAVHGAAWLSALIYGPRYNIQTKDVLLMDRVPGRFALRANNNPQTEKEIFKDGKLVPWSCDVKFEHKPDDPRISSLQIYDLCLDDAWVNFDVLEKPNQRKCVNKLTIRVQLDLNGMFQLSSPDVEVIETDQRTKMFHPGLSENVASFKLREKEALKRTKLANELEATCFDQARKGGNKDKDVCDEILDWLLNVQDLTSDKLETQFKRLGLSPQTI